MNIKRVEKYAEMLKGIQYIEWLELQEELRLNFGEKEEGGEK
ncbi:hypothetical protein [Lachnoanaerobaculum sp. Marseille-Q4761]|nr:hypothetical protein [Lachnoanaerobaculum sp. Marseille-Q4761]